MADTVTSSEFLSHQLVSFGVAEKIYLMSRETFRKFSLTLAIPMYNPQVESTAIVQKKILKKYSNESPSGRQAKVGAHQNFL